MTDLNKEREAFEEALGKHNIHNVHLCTVYDFKRNEYFPSDVCDPSEDRIVDSINLSWKMWQEKAKAQAVPEGYVLLPRVPTEKMFQAYERYSVAPMSTLSKTGYKAMINASESGAEG